MNSQQAAALREHQPLGVQWPRIATLLRRTTTAVNYRRPAAAESTFRRGERALPREISILRSPHAFTTDSQHVPPAPRGQNDATKAAGAVHRKPRNGNRSIAEHSAAFRPMGRASKVSQLREVAHVTRVVIAGPEHFVENCAKLIVHLAFVFYPRQGIGP
jgi:hypothetical protein